MNGAQLIMRTAIKAGIEVCFTNFETTEMPSVLPFDRQSGVKPLLGLFEGVCTGAADGYGRMMDKPAMTACQTETDHEIGGERKSKRESGFLLV